MKVVDVVSPARVHAIARNTFREAVRNRAFIGLLLAALAFIASSMLMSELVVVGQGPRVIQTFGFFAIGLFCVATAVVMGALLLHKELDKKTIYTIIAKPVHRYEFVLGKFCGMLGILVLELVLLGFVWALVLGHQDVALSIEHVKGLVLILFEVTLVTAVAVMFSSFSTPILTALFTTATFAVGRVVYVFEEMLQSTRGAMAGDSPLRTFGEVVAAVFPDLSVFNTSQQVLLGIETTWAYIGSALLYAAAYGAVCLAVAMIAFERRDFV